MEAAAKATVLEDALLVQRMQEGDGSAFGELVRRYQDRVYNAVWRICGSSEDAQDVTQDSFLKALESIGSFKGESGFYTWLFRIAVNRALSHRRTKKRRPTQSLDAGSQVGGTDSSASPLAARIGDARPGPVKQAMSAEAQNHVVTALQRLEDEFRTVIVLRDIEGFDYAQIAEVLQVAPGTVKSRLHRARQALRKLLTPVLGQEP